VKDVFDQLIPLYVSNIKELAFDMERSKVLPIVRKPQEKVKLARWEMDVRQGFIFSLQNLFTPKVNAQYYPSHRSPLLV
jgi:hypothetical protein